MWSDSPFHKAPNYILNRLICFCWILYSSLQYVLFIPVYNQTMFSYFPYIYLGGRGVVCFCAPSILIKYRGWAAHIRSFCSVFCTVFFFSEDGLLSPFLMRVFRGYQGNCWIQFHFSCWVCLVHVHSTIIFEANSFLALISSTRRSLFMEKEFSCLCRIVEFFLLFYC